MESNSNSKVDYSRPQLKPKKWEVNDDIVISGISGRFPESDNIDELAANLLNNVDMVTRDDRRWPIGLNDNQASRSGKLIELAHFDNTYFCTLPVLADHMEPGSRIILETTYEAIADSGIAPQQIRGSKTGVYVGINTVANAEAIPQDDFSDIRAKDAAFWVYGSSKALLANRISFLFDLIGPSTVIDTACSSSLVALTNAVHDLRTGNCEMAIVATANICLAPYSSYVFHSLGLLSSDGKCKVFDKNADGFVRSETVGSLFLMKRSAAKRIYATIRHAKTNTDGFKTIGLFAPFWLRQRNLMIETFQEAGIDPHQVMYFESHGTGTNVGDPQEAKAVSEAYCFNRPDKLLVGAVKSNLGHTEGASGLCSIAKGIIILERGIIPANLHYQQPKSEIECLHQTIEPVVKNTPFTGRIIGVNSFGVGGVNAHTLLESNPKLANDSLYDITEPIPRLVTVCGRTEEAVAHIFDFIEQNPHKVHRDFLALLNDSMKTTPIKGSANFPYRGYMLIEQTDSCNDNGNGNENVSHQRYKYVRTIEDSKLNEPLWLIFSGMGSQWSGMGKSLMSVDIYHKSLLNSAQVLAPYGIDLMRLVQSDDEQIWKENTVNAFVAITAMQIALFDIIDRLELPIEGIIGHSFGEIACAYADGCLTAEQALLTSYWRGQTVVEANLPKGAMAAVGLTWQQTKELCPKDVYVACHNGHDSVTVSGLYEPMMAFVEKLKSDNVFVRRVNGGEYPYHSVVMREVATKLLEKLDAVIPCPKQRSAKWISTSVNEEEVNNECSLYASGQYFVNNLQNPVLFEEGMRQVPKKACCVEVAPHALFDSIFKRCYKDRDYISLMRKTESNNLLYFLSALGKIYTCGFNPSIEQLYPPIEWPVARGTQSISSLIKWDHSKKHEIKQYPEYHNFSTASTYIIKLSTLDSDWRFLKDHCIDGRIVFPVTGYLMLVWRAMATKVGQPWHKVPIQFENVRICRPTLLNDNNQVKFKVQILEKSGEFVLNEGTNLVCTGKVSVPDTGEQFLELQDLVATEEDAFVDCSHNVDQHGLVLDNQEVYKELKIRGYDYGRSFQGLIEACGDGSAGVVQWTGNWISFVDSALHLSLLALPIRALFIPIGIDLFKCDPRVLFSSIKKSKEENNKGEHKDSTAITNKQQLKTEFCYFRDLDKHNEMLKQSEMEIDEMAKNDQTIPFEIINFSFETNTAECKKKLHFHVNFNFVNQLLVTKGVEVKGLLPINIPRKVNHQHLQLERYQFVPMIEESLFECDQQLQQYIEACTSALAQIDSKFDLNLNLTQSEMENSTQYHSTWLNRNSDANVYSYLNVLNSIVQPQADNQTVLLDTSVELCKHLEDNFALFEIDTLNAGLLQYAELFARPVFELIAENCQHLSSIKVLEICPTFQLLNETITNSLKQNVIHKFELDYVATKHTALRLSDNNESNLIKFIEWNRTDLKFLNDVSGNLDLVVIRRNAFTDQLWSSVDSVNQIIEILKPGGFVLIISRDQLLPFEQALNILTSQQLQPHLITDQRSGEMLKTALTSSGDRLLSVMKRRHTLTGTELRLYRKPVWHDVEGNKKSLNVRCVCIDPVDRFDIWLEPLKENIRQITEEANENARLWIVAHGTHSGILGLGNCLRLESPYGSKVRILLAVDEQQSNNFSVKHFVDLSSSNSVIRELVLKDLATNVLRNGQWGSYRFVGVNEQQKMVQTEHAYLSQLHRGDLSSLKWFQSEFGCFNHHQPPQLSNGKELLCDVYYSAINFKDVVIASGKIVPGPESALFDSVLGLEFAGRRKDNGERVMGMVPFKGIATTVLTHQDFVWPVPSHWSLKEAATVPVVYLTAYYALLIRARLQQGESVLIHSAAGGVGQAAMNICLNLRCKIYVTVGTEEKRQFIQTHFGIDPSQIFSSRDVSFERQLKTATNGKGVDVVLNSLTGEKLQASLRCLAVNGRFLELGKFDMQMNNQLGMFIFLNNITFHGVGLDCFFREGLSSKKLDSFLSEVSTHLQQGITDGVVKPINQTVFERNQVEQAFRHMTSGQHIGKVLIRIRHEEQPTADTVLKPIPVIMTASARSWFSLHNVYIIAGGLGGVGLELTYWMVLQGARKFVLTTRSGLRTAFQKVFLQRFKVIEDYCAEYKIMFHIAKKNIAIESECRELLEQASEFGNIAGIFNLTLVLHDGLLESQTVETFDAVCKPKLQGLLNLDRVSREKQLQLDHFVAFSSYSAGRGNAGQSNYGLANSAMEQIIECRNRDDLNGIAIQFGPIGDVGVVAEHLRGEQETENEEAIKLLMGLEIQRINSCMEVLNQILPLKKGVYSSYVRYAKNVHKGGTDDEVIRQLCLHLNIDKRPEDECLGDIGLDSMAAVEIQQRLERDFNITLSLADVRKITVKELKNFRDGNRHNLKQYSDDIKKAKINLSRIRFVIPTIELVALNTVQEGKPIYCLPPLKGVFDLISMLVQKCNRPVIGLNWTAKLNEFKSFKEITKYYFEMLAKLNAGTGGTYDLLVTSFGSLIAGLICKSKRMSKVIKVGQLVLLDLWPVSLEDMTDETLLPDYKVKLMFNYIRIYIPERICEQSMKEIMELNCEQERVKKTAELMRKCVGSSLQGNDMAEIVANTYQRASLMLQYQFELRRKSKASLQRLLIEVMHRNPTIRLDLVKLVNKSSTLTFQQQRRKLVSIFDLEQFEDQYQDRYQLHLVEGNLSELFDKLDGTFQGLLVSIIDPKS